jgi:predicted metal-dependent hydrolase
VRKPRNNQLELPLRLVPQQVVGRGHLALDGRIVTYTIKRSIRRRVISILVDEDGVRVGAPWNAPQTAIEGLLRRHARWVLRKLAEWDERRPPPRRWSDGEALMLLGDRLTLRVTPSSTPRPIHVLGSDIVIAAAGESARSVGSRVQEWLREQALCCFADRVRHFRLAAGIPMSPEVFLSSARTRWGSCHVSGRIRLNWRLVQMPLRLIDYVVAHEVAHLVEMNHSQRFWRTVAGMVPDYAARRRELRCDGHRYLLV